jgi:hypothetical protein
MNSSMNYLLDRLVDMVDEDLDDPGTAFFSTSQTQSVSLKLQDLIDPERMFWKDYRPSSAIRSLDDEREAYELMDLDAEGEDAGQDLIYDMDLSLADVF